MAYRNYHLSRVKIDGRKYKVSANFDSRTYMGNLFYDFDILGCPVTPYIGIGGGDKTREKDHGIGLSLKRYF